MFKTRNGWGGKIGPVFIYRCSNYLRLQNFSRLSVVLDFLNRFCFGCWVPGKMTCGKDLVLGYWGMSIVDHSDCKLGDRVHIGQCVTIGGNGTQLGVPKIGSDVYIGAGAKVLGPIMIADNCLIAANAVVLKDVPEGSIVAGVLARVVKSDITLASYLYHLKKE